MTIDEQYFYDCCTETVARVILHKNRIKEGQLNPSTDDWRELYNPSHLHSEHSAFDRPIMYNIFRAEVEGTVYCIMKALQKSKRDGRP